MSYKNTKSQIIARGAEAILTKQDNQLIKHRIKKSYRIQELDEKLRKSRTKKEAKLIEKASQLISVPKIIKISESEKKIFMNFIEGKKLSDWLEKLNYKKICKKIGQNIAKLHDSDIIHGDLTTSNMILKNNDVFFVDFGLGFTSKRIEDKAVDLHLLKQALEAKHFTIYKQAFNSVLKGYNTKEKAKILEQLKKVESRGRYKH